MRLSRSLTVSALYLATILAPVASIIGAAHCQLVADAVYECDTHRSAAHCEVAAEHPRTAAWFRR